MLSFSDCPTDIPNYSLVQGKCYFFETTKLDHQSARANCNAKFRSEGKLFEPRSLEINSEVFFKAESEFGSLLIKSPTGTGWLLNSARIWIGVSDIDDDNIFKYTESKQVLNMTPSWAPGNPSNFWKGGDENCVEFAFVSDAKWNDRDCSAEQFSICESK